MKPARLMLLLCLLVTIGQFATVIYLPSMPAIAASLHTTAKLTEITLTIYMFSFALSQLIYGPLSDLYGRKPTIRIAFMVYFIGSLGSAFSPSVSCLIIARLIEGFGAGGISALARAMINDHFHGKTLTRALSYSAIAASLTSMLSPILGGFIQEQLDWRINFIFLALYSAVFFVIACKAIPQQKPAKKPNKVLSVTLQNYCELAKSRHFVAFAFMTGSSFAGITSYYAASPFIFQNVLHFSPSNYGLLFLITSGGFIAGSFFNANTSFSIDTKIQAGLALMLISSLSLWLCGLAGYLNAYAILIPVCALMLAISIVFTSSMTCAVKPYTHIAGSAAAIVGCMQLLGACIGTTITAHLAQNTQTPLAAFLLLLAIMTATIYYYCQPKTS